jgi:DNA uptake protein ComE-like DNA-binding protein
MRRFLLVITTLLLLGQTACGQKNWQQALQAWMTAEDMEDSYAENTMEMLQERAEQPLNLNQTSREELEQLPFLTAQQVEDIVEYLNRYSPIRSVGELQMVKSLDYDTRQLLEYFVVVGPEKGKSCWPKMRDVLKYGKHSLTATGKIPFYERKGDRNGYLGYKYRHDLRYQFTYNDRIKVGLTAAQDAGEPLFTNGNSTGYDHYSYYFQLRHIGRLEALNIGMFRVQMGMGLVMNNGFNLGKLATLQSMGRSTHILTAHTSRSSANYLRGAAATVRIAKRWQVTAFASYRPIDATLNSNGSVRTIVTNGYHRTPTEMAKKHNTHQTDYGGSIGYRKGTLYANANVVFTHLNRQLNPMKANTPYRRYAIEGNNFLNISADYGYNNSRFSLAGETAINRQGAIATIHTISYRLNDALSVMALHRYYDKSYTALHANSFCEGSSVQNEHGIYAGVNWQPHRSLQLRWYADYAHFAWARYQVSVPSDAFDTMLSARWRFKQWTFDGRYRLHVKQRDNSEKTRVENRTEHRIHLLAGFTASQRLQLVTQADGILVNFVGSNSRGYIVSEQAQWQWRWLRINAHAAYFHTDNYESRLYQYERSVQHDFSYPMYYGHGLRYALMAFANIGSHLKASAKLGVTDYFDRSTIGSGLQQINRSAMTDLTLQLQVML